MLRLTRLSAPLRAGAAPVRTLCASAAGSSRDNVLRAPLDDVPGLHPAVRDALSMRNASQRELNAAHITETIAKYRRSVSDTGSPEVQVAVMTERIRNLTVHMKGHRKDKGTERNLVALVNKRRSMMQYLLRKSPERYLEVVRALGLRETTVFNKDIGVKGAKNAPSQLLRYND